eukprot:TRINITY_DN14273_c0_g1_i1.p1 TRINITY_DN14273_c0_g1~~TRINITY_DN14273_c0_g1_i1.p1  ORF type:complete len:678 (+),score=145.08 TRINITY_DN14273_c0_g1_i1:271-2034(+)
MDEDHTILIDSVVSFLCDSKEQHSATLSKWFSHISDFLSLSREQGVRENNPNVLLKHQRLIIIIADLLWTLETKCPKSKVTSFLKADSFDGFLTTITKNSDLKQKIKDILFRDNSKFIGDEEEYYGFLDLFLKAANERELQDFEICTAEYVHRLAKTERSLKWNHEDINSSFSTISGMRIGISSANASDNWTNAKLRGGRVVNVSVNLFGQPPVSAEISRTRSTDDVLLTLVSTDSLSGELGTSEVSFTKEDLRLLGEFGDNKDPFRMLKCAFFFVGILLEHSSPAELLRQFVSFAGESCTLKLSLTNLGPSRSGFASSSAVSSNLLKVLYMASGQDEIANDLNAFGSLVLLFENRLGLKSGRQDVDGLLPDGFKNLTYGPTSETLLPKLDQSKFLGFNFDEVPGNLIVVDSGIQRPSHLGRKRGLNMRHWTLLSRNKERFPAIRKSYGVHHHIVNAFVKLDWARVGELFLVYMGLRETIDSGATMSIYDENHGRRLLRDLFDPFKAEGIIHGGMFTGAMGGGVAMLVPSAIGKTLLEDGKTTLLVSKLQKLAELEVDMALPFAHLRVFQYSVNLHGIKCSVSELLS